ncbi:MULTISPECIES: molybdopterin molybdotransferase MoeA [unclassified Alteromonas]|uniref:molybdopterin molybdotransferase MoeA n=1 Tax=unclassified Alteromonas TaxID=2614992 RepID=UPI000509D1A6|nr:MULTISPECIES: gephyrin-like molybdotransferase Glp [unclassified Alteromonas]
MSSSWLSLEEALSKALAATHVVSDIETISLFSAHRRVVAQDIVALLDVPPWDNSAMDGFAINAKSYTQGQALTVQGIIPAGEKASTPLSAGHAYKIMTGAPIPDGANAVVMIENCDSDNNGNVIINDTPTQGQNIRAKANDIAQGQVLIKKGTQLRAEHLMLLSSQGLDEVVVYRKLRVGIVATGNELAAPGESRSDTQIYESNRVGISAILSDENVEVVDFGIVEDDKASLTRLFNQAASNTAGTNTKTSADNNVDIMVSSGGVSVGDADYVKDVIEAMGHIEFWKIAVKPGKPFALGRLNNTVFCGLPGNPVSSFVTAKLLVLPIISKMQGRQDGHTALTVTATLTKDIKRRAGRRDYQRATMSYDDNGNLVVTPFKTQSSGVMTSITSANCFMIIHEDISTLAIGDTVPVMPFT